MAEEKHKATYIMVPRRLIRAWIAVNIILFVLIIASFQYTNYVDRRSNGFWCGVITIFNDTYKKEPPATDTGKILAQEFIKIRRKFKCI